MKRAAKVMSGLGCLVSVLAPLAAIELYPRANWLFAFVLVGIALLALFNRSAKDPTPQALADDVERLLSGTFGTYDVDDYESFPPRDPQLRELWRRSMDVGGLPEEWVRLDESKKAELREIIRTLRQLDVTQR